MPPFVVLKHIKLSNLIKQKATNKGQLSQSRMSDQHGQFIHGYSLMITSIKNIAYSRLYTNLLLFQRSVYKQKLFPLARLPILLNKNITGLSCKEHRSLTKNNK